MWPGRRASGTAEGPRALEDLAPEATEDVDLPPAPTDSQVFDFRDKVKGVEEKAEEPRIAEERYGSVASEERLNMDSPKKILPMPTP